MVPWNAARTKVQIKLSIQRLRTLQEKKHAMAKKSRRDIADLLLKNRVETARLRVEGLIQDDIYVELLELLELYSEKLQARFNLLDASSGTEPEASISDAVCAIVFAAPRTELKELQVLREMLMQKYGRAFALTLASTESPPDTVPARVKSKLALYTPARELVDAYLYEIAEGYGVNWTPEPPADEKEASGSDKEDALGAAKSDKEDDGENEDDGPGGGIEDGLKVALAEEKEAGSTTEKKSEEKTKAPPAADKGADDATKTGDVNVAPAQPPAAKRKKLSPEEELGQRFARLKKI